MKAWRVRPGRAWAGLPSLLKERAMADQPTLTPAAELAAKNTYRMPNESADYRRARNALLAEEIELRRHLERVAEQRRALPPGGEVKKSYKFQSERGPVTFADL